MMSVIERLRSGKGSDPESHWLMIEAADEIERLREALDCLVAYWDEWKDEPDNQYALSLEEVVTIARTTLKKDK
jgi:alkanesulfonate monooxygenase SsuD/methylene tetrahydromethanopterin reductase-like flavin-dependent oxidoreductase (luciferase family)